MYVHACCMYIPCMRNRVPLLIIMIVTPLDRIVEFEVDLEGGVAEFCGTDSPRLGLSDPVNPTPFKMKLILNWCSIYII